MSKVIIAAIQLVLVIAAYGQGRLITHPGLSFRLPASSGSVTPCCAGATARIGHGSAAFQRGGGPTTIPYIVPYPVFVNSPDPIDNSADDEMPADPPQDATPSVPTFGPSGDAVLPQSVYERSDAGPSTSKHDPPESGFACPATPPASPDADAHAGSLVFIALKDSRVYVAVAYWILAQTLHYITPAGIHNQVSVPLIDQQLSSKLNAAHEFKLLLPAE